MVTKPTAMVAASVCERALAFARAKGRGFRLTIASAFVVGLALIAYVNALSYEPTQPGDQGCINQGTDRRFAAVPICWAQRHFSWKSDYEPHFVSIGNLSRTNLGMAWPPYLVVNWYAGPGRWRMFRIGFRYDRNWRGYIFPTIALKVLSSPLQY